MTYPQPTEKFACLRCGREMDYDWLPCSECGWKSTDPWDDEEGREGSQAPPRKATLTGRWVKWVGWTLIMVLGVLIVFGLF